MDVKFTFIYSKQGFKILKTKSTLHFMVGEVLFCKTWNKCSILLTQWCKIGCVHTRRILMQL